MVFNSINKDSVETQIQEENIPKLSNNDIKIITPDNITYSKPMSGFYPATYGFENDGDGDDPEGWIIEEEFAGDIEIVSEKVGHKKVLKLPDYGSQRLILHQPFDDYQVNGTVEFWILSEDTNEASTINVGDENAGEAWQHGVYILFADGGKINLYNGSDWVDVYSNLQPNEWYHVRIEFDLTDDWHLWLNGEQLDSGGFAFMGTPLSMTQLRFGAQGAVTPVAFFDAIGYSWDPNYNIGDNLNEGLLLSFENSTNLNWQGYSLNGQNNKTILGNTTIPMPEEGIHTIQVYGNDTLGTMYQSDKRYFTADFPIDIITPESKIYKGSMDGYYPATYGFEDVLDDTTPTYVEYYAFGTVPDYVTSYTEVIMEYQQWIL